jgi:hypothetical protein
VGGGDAAGSVLALEDREEPVVLSMQPGRSAAAAAEHEPSATARHMAAFSAEDDDDGAPWQAAWHLAASPTPRIRDLCACASSCT